MSAPTESEVRYRTFSAELTADALEREVAERWTRDGVFEAAQKLHADDEPWVFYEGPPTANGRPGIHHVLARTVKDLFCRHRAMKGHHVPRKAGWDTHGLPVEIEVEKALGISGKQDIDRVGVAEFNRLCRESVWKYKSDWERLSARMAYWLDYSDPYVTYSNEYVESVWWALKTLHAKGLLYLGHKILPYCPRCGTTLSSHEVAQGYEDVEDPSVYVALDLSVERETADGGRRTADRSPAGSGARSSAGSDVRSPSGSGARSSVRRRIIVWTTTPWTLVSNVALAVHPELEYVELRKKTVEDWTVILAASRAGAVLGADYADRWNTVATMRGAALVGLKYKRPLDWVEYPDEGQHEIIVGEEFVTADDGSGVVHMAPAFGADDYAAGQRHGLAFLKPVDDRGEFPAGMPLVGGKFVKDADPLIIEELERRGKLWKSQKFVHSYPHCWRCGTPLLYFARSSWFIRTTKYRDAMIARNAHVNWNPDDMREGRFGGWLENNIDWAISRDRYWGTPLPVWVNDADPTEVEVIGSYAELMEKVGLGADLTAKVGKASVPDDFDPHKPFVDEYTWPAASGTGTMRRVPQVIDAWFDSGSMPFAQWGYPHRPGSEALVKRYFPADFIAEGVDQTRGWFYSMLAIATGLGDALPNNASNDAAVPYKAVVVNDQVLDAAGQKMSKSRGNTVDPHLVLERHGADAVRLFLMASSQLWVPRRFDEAVIRESAGRFLVTLRNVYGGIFAQYANFGWSPSDADPAAADRPVLDRWVLSRLAAVESEADALLQSFDATAAARTLMDFVTEDVANWYVRQSRARFYDVTDDDNRAAFATLHEVLVVTSRLLAPFAPYVSDWIHHELTGTSVHLAPYTRATDAAQGRSRDAGSGREGMPRDLALEDAMRAARTIATLGRAARESAGIRVRQPLGVLTCVAPGVPADRHAMIAPIVASELNVKSVTFADSAADWVRLEGKPNFPVLGKVFGAAMKAAKPVVEGLSQDDLRTIERGGTVTAEVPGHGPVDLDASRVQITARAATALVVQQGEGFSVALDPEITPELRAEGMARELVSRVQRLRKESGLAVSDRIRLAIAAPREVQAAVLAHHAWIAREVLAREPITLGDGLPATFAWDGTSEVDLDGPVARIALFKDI